MVKRYRHASLQNEEGQFCNNAGLLETDFLPGTFHGPRSTNWWSTRNRSFSLVRRNMMADPKRNIQGEGDKESDRKYRERTTEFVRSERGREEIERAGNLSEEEAKRLRQYEDKGKSRAKDEDPQIKNQSKH
jgi:hypothetical protein